MVEDVRLSYTYIRLDDGHRLIVPNERLAQSSIENHTIGDPRVQVEVSVWLQPERRPRPRDRADRRGTASTPASPRSTRRACGSAPPPGPPSPAERGRVGEELRRRWLRQLREHGLSSEAAAS